MPGPSGDLCCNIDDVDPISLADVRDLQHFFYVSTDSGRVEACDAVAWLRYFTYTPDKWPTHPCTRAKLDPKAIWDCYTVSYGVLGEGDADIVKMHTDKVHAQVEGNLVELRARSPLFVVCIREVKIIAENEADGDKKNIRICYDLVSSADVSSKRNRSGKPYSLLVTVPRSFCVSITR